ncbi:division abnormally delayed protein [Trichoplusia ni]|uniref:Division abnormally delayed protein n=1 Tax=Trichoplusia ni TaxID=7111 RepID=A0A7E5VDJ7_TRINI|nr:division abnormally delayed protein [Trichoplusia ni]
MRCFVVILLLVACARLSAAAAGVSCALADEFLARHNVTADDNDVPGPICGGQCCGRGREEKVRSALRRTAEFSMTVSTKRTAELLLSTKRSLQDHLTGLSHQSQNKTATLFTQLYRGHATRTVQPLAALYDDIRIVLRSNEADISTENLGAGPPKDLAASAKKFFREIFPVAYHNVLKLDSKQFSPEYEVCLKYAYDAVQPFGDVPQQLGTSLSRSLEAARALLQMLAVGADALATTERVVASGSETCAERLMRASGCSRCHGHDARPCRHYCLNVARGCIGSLVSELDGPWAGYVEGVERLTKVDADVALREVETKVSKAIMYALENRAISENKVRQECGPPATLDGPALTSPRPTSGSIRRENLRAPPPDTELLQFAATLASTKKLFATLADRLCNEPDFAADNNERCWNGNAIGDYTKPLVASASLSDQKYNPEISGSPPQDARVAALADRLQQARQLLVSYSRSKELTAESFMQGDEAGEEGSGSGRNYPDDYDSEGSGDDGSGDHDGQSKPYFNESPPDSSTPKVLSSGAARASCAALALCALAAALAALT